MLTETFVSSILQASITGAGLIFAIYAIIVPNISKIIENRLNSLNKLRVELEMIFRESKKKKTTEIDIYKIREKIDSLESLKGKPFFFSGAALASFTLYLFTVLLCQGWFLDANILNYTKFDFENWIPVTFGVATIIFGILGYQSIDTIIKIFDESFIERNVS